MNNVKFSLAAVLSGIAAITFGFVSFLGINFMWKGEVMKSVLAALTISAVLVLIVLLAKKIKSARRNFKNNALYEIILLALYFVVAFITIIPFSHYFTVRDRKEEIKSKIVDDVNNTKKMFVAYDTNAKNRVEVYEGQLKTAINGQQFNNADYLAMGFQNTGESNTKQKERLMRIFEDDLMPDQYDSTKVTAMKWLDDAEQIATEWKPIGLMDVVKTIDLESNKWLSEVKKYDQSTSKANREPFEYQISFAGIDSELTEKNPPTFVALLSGILLYLLILFPYWFGARDNRSSGLWQSLFPKDEEDETDGFGRL